MGKLLCLVVVLSLVALSASEININFANMLVGYPGNGGSGSGSGSGSGFPTCPATNYASATASKGVFEDLSVDETKAVRDWTNTNLKLVRYEDALLSDSYIYSIEAAIPPKAEALAFFNGNGPKPGRFAKVVVYHGSLSPPVVREYKVGPIPFGAGSSAVQTDEIPYNRRQVCDKESGLVHGDVMNRLAQTLSPLFKASYGVYTYHTECQLNCFYAVDTAPRGYTLNERKTWYWFIVNDFEGGYLTPSGFEFQVDHASLNPADWKVIRVWYNGQLFSSPEALLDAFNKGTLNVKVVKFDSFFASFTRRGDTFDKEKMAPPRLVEPQGKRYTISNNRVNYLGWSFEFKVAPNAGLSIWDARFMGQRLVYEAGCAEASATYSGSSPVGARTSYLDSAWGIGKSATQLKQGYDCPYNAHFQDLVIFFSSGEPTVVKNGLCIFEAETGFPIKRHYDPLPKNGRSWGFLGTTFGSALVIRTVTAVWNYDYFFEYVFHPTGHFEPRVSTSGYLQASYYRPEETDFARRIRDFTQGQLHDHILHYKLDIDIDGPQNSFEISRIVSDTSNLPFFEQPHTQKKVVEVIADKETGLKYNFSEPSLWAIVNENSLNKWGQKRGVKLSCTALVKNVIDDTSPLIGALSWSKYQLSVTKRKDSEPSSTSQYNQAIMSSPHVDFDKTILNGENIQNEDLVAWVTLGVIHLPHAEDVPNTVTPGHVASIFVSPYNYFDEEISTRMWNNYIVRPGANGGIEEDTIPEPATCVPKVDKVPFVAPA